MVELYNIFVSGYT